LCGPVNLLLPARLSWGNAAPILLASSPPRCDNRQLGADAFPGRNTSMPRPHQALLLLLLTGLASAAAADPPAAPRAPFFEKLWAQPTIREEQTRNWLDRQVLPYLEQRGEPVLPATSPLVVGDRLLFRSNWGVHAVNLRTGKLEWESDSRWSVDRMLRDPGKTGALTFWLNAYLTSNRPGALFENSLIGSLSTDGHRLFAVEDFQVAPFRPQNGAPNMASSYGPGIGEAIQHSRLQAFDLVTGKLIWELGASPEPGDAGPPRDDPTDVSGSYFLSAPLVLDGKLYVLNEKDANLRLVCLEPEHGGVVWVQHLASFRSGLSLDPARRMRGDGLAYADGVMVCPTNAGILLAIDLPSRILLWAHDYRPPAPPAPNQAALQRQLALAGGRPAAAPANFHWRYSPPFIQNGKVVFAPEDGNSILCLDLRAGTLLWGSHARPDDLYVAGVFPGRDKQTDEGRVLVVGKKSCRALSLAEGKVLWTRQAGLPSGKGAADGQTYYLPLKEAVHTGAPEVLALNVEDGQLLAHTPARNGEVPGNLVLHDGLVVSQTVAEVSVYPQVRARLRQIDGLLKKDPHDARALLERGELKLGEGDRSGAVEDLRAALAGQPPAEVRARGRGELFAALSDLLAKDFAGGEKYLDDYAKLCRVEVPATATDRERRERLAEQQRRRATYAFVVGRGRERQGRLRPAVRAYLDLLAAGGDEVVTSPDDPGVRVARAAWAGAHVASLLKGTDGDRRRDLNDELATRRDALRSGKDPEALRRFGQALAGTPAGRQGLWLLAERLRQGGAFLEAERALLQIRDQATEPAEAGRAVEALARLYADRGLAEDAAWCYRLLARDYPNTAIRAGKTGRGLFDEAGKDRRVAAFLAGPNPTPPGRLKVQAGFGNYPQPQALVTFEPEGEVLPFFERYRLAVDLNNHRLRLLDRVTNEERWGQELTIGNLPNLVNSANPQVPFRPRFQVVGHLVLLNVGHLVYALDPVDHKVLWEQSLLGPLETLAVRNFSFDPSDGKPFVLYQDGWVQKLGQVGIVGAGAVCLQTRGGLLALDPLRGTVLWSRADVAPRTIFLGDARNLVVLEADATGRALGTRAFRGSDGASIDVKDGSSLYPRRLGILGRGLLLGNAEGGDFVLHLYDVLAGKDVWEKKFPAGSRALRCEDPSLAGAVEPDGRVTVLDAASGRRVARAAIDPKDLSGGTQVDLLADRAQFYVACDHPANGPLFANVAVGAGLRALPVNGNVYAFDRATGELNWKAKATNQMLVVDQFADLPVLLFAGRALQAVVQNGRFMQTQSTAVRVIGKRTGKLLYDEPAVNNVQPFHSLNRTADGSSVELVSPNFRVAVARER
jgi:outer membrane protein assembly factor BamB/tetratricopeptide (TPR) repeat protein